MDGRIDRRFVGGVLLAGGVLAMLGNGLHPILDPDGGARELVAMAGDTAYWTALHLVVVIAVVLLTAGTVMYARSFAGRPPGSPPRSRSSGAPSSPCRSAASTAPSCRPWRTSSPRGDKASVMAAASALLAFDVGLLAIVTILYLGGTFVALGWAMHVTASSYAWIRWTALVAGSAGVVVGTLMYLGVADVVAFYVFRLVVLAVTVAALGLAVELRRSETPAGVPSSAAPA